MQRNKLSEDKGKTDRVIQTDPAKIERDVDKAERVVQTDPTIFNEEEKMEASSDDSEMDPIVTKKPTVESFESIMKNVKLKEAHKFKRAEKVFDFILQSNQITIGEESQLIYLDNKPTDVQVSSFLYDLQQPTKKIDQEAYSRILLVLRLEPDLVSNTYAKQILEIFNDQEFSKLATAGRHKNLSVIYVKHNLFQQSRWLRTIDLITTHIILFKSPRDVQQIALIGWTSIKLPASYQTALWSFIN